MPLRKINIFDDLSKRMRLEINPYVAALKERCSDPAFPALYGNALRGLKGQWRTYFAERNVAKEQPAQLVLEIGMHKGKSLAAMANEQPSWGFVGMDITYKRVVLTAERIREAGRDNLCAILGDARHCGELFAPEELSGVVVFFPDPWSKKKRQAHNRLLTPEFCENIADLLQTQGFFWLKTDCSRYFADVAAYFSASPRFVADSEPPMQLTGHLTTFEEKFTKQGLPIYQGIWRKQLPVLSGQEKTSDDSAGEFC